MLTRPGRFAVLFFLLLGVAFFGRALFTGGVLLPVDALFLYPPWRAYTDQFGIGVPNNHLIADTILQNYSWKALAAQAYAAGQFPLWNPYILAGQPFLASGQNASLYLPGVLFYLLPWGHAYAPFAAVHLALGGALTYWLVRVLGGTRFGALVGGTTFAFCGYLVVSILWPMVVSTAVWLPGLLAVVESVVQRVALSSERRTTEALEPEVGRSSAPAQSPPERLEVPPKDAAEPRRGSLRKRKGKRKKRKGAAASAHQSAPARAKQSVTAPERVIVAAVEPVGIAPPKGRRLGVVPLLLIGAGIVTLQFLAGHLEMSLYLLLTAGLYTAIRLVGIMLRGMFSRSSALPLSRSFAVGVVLLGTVTLGSLGAAAQLAPFIEVIAANVRGGQVSYEEVRGYAMPRQQLAAFAVPDVFGNPSHHAVFDLFRGRQRPVDYPISIEPEQRWGTEWGPKNYVEGTAYLGILPLLLALLALLVRRDGATWTLAAVAAVSLLFAFGTPLYALLFYGLPGVNQLHTPFRWVYPYSLCIAALAGLGASLLEGSRAPSPSGRGRGVRATGEVRTLLGTPAAPTPTLSQGESGFTARSPAVVGTLVAILGALAAAGLLAAYWWRRSLLGLAERAAFRFRQPREVFPDTEAFFSYEWANLLGAALLLLASGLVVLALARRAPGARPLALALLVGDLFSFGIGFNTVTSPAPLALQPPPIEAISADDSLFRIATFGPDDTLPANTNMLFGLQDIRGYDTIILRDYVAYLELIEPQTGLLFSKVHKLFDPRSLDSPLLDLLNVKYVLTTLRVDSPGWRLVHEGPSAAGSEQGVRVYENQRVIPRAFLVEQALGAADLDQARQLLARPAFDPRREVILEGVIPPPSTVREPGFGFEGAVGPQPIVTSYHLNRVVVQALTVRPGYLVLADMHFSGWTARVDGVEQPLLRANGIFRAVRLPPGQHEVVFEYRPLSFRLGGLLSLLAVGLGGLVLGGWLYLGHGRARVDALGPVGRVAKNALFPLATGLLNRALDFGFALVYLRLLGPQGVGAYTFAVVIVGYFDILVNFGLGTLLTREVARSPAETDRYFGNTLVVRLGLATVALLVALLLAGPLAGPLEIGPEVGLAIVLLTAGMLPGALASTSSALFQARERMEVPAAVTVLGTLLRIGLGTAALLTGWGVVGLAVVSLVVNVVNALVLGGLQVGLLGWPRLGFELPFSRGLLVTSWPLMLNNLLNSLFFRIDAVLLKPLAGEVALGHYGTAYKFIDGLQIIPSTFVLALFPHLARQAGEDRAALARAFGLGLKVLLVLAIPISVGTTLLAEPIIELFAGPAYLPDSALALQVLIWFLPFSFVNGLTQYVLIALNRQRWITLSFFAAAALNLALNLWAIPRYGYLGAAAITVISEWVLFAPFWYVVRKDLPRVPLLSLTWRPVLAALLMGLAVYWLRAFNPWLAIPAGGAIYGVTLLALGGVSRAELATLRRRS